MGGWVRAVDWRPFHNNLTQVCFAFAEHYNGDIGGRLTLCTVDSAEQRDGGIATIGDSPQYCN